MSDNSSDDEKLTGSETFEKVGLHVQKVQLMLEREALRIQQERDSFESVAKKLKHVHFSSTIKLNVGGQMFTTSLQTLTKDAGSMLHAMFSGRFDTKPAEDGSYFIDRDGTCFGFILNYLRTGKLLLPNDELLRKEVLEEAKFYQIRGIVEPYSESVILSADQRQWLTDVHGDNRVFTGSVLLYRATRDGWGASAFHLKCDYFEGATMVVIKSTENYIFGGYTEESWKEKENEEDTYKLDWEAFLFSLVRPGGTTPIILKEKDYAFRAVYCNYKYGPTFGRDEDDEESDLLIFSYPNTQDCIVDLGHTFKYPKNMSSDFLTGRKYFNISEMEVFGLVS